MAITVAIVSTRAAREQQRLQASLARLDELRNVLDSAALELRDALYDANGVWSLLDAPREDGPDPNEIRFEFEKHLNAMDDWKTRIDVRLGRSSALSQQFEACRAHLWPLHQHFVGATFQGQAFDSVETERLLTAARAEYERFIDAATNLLSPDLTLAATNPTERATSPAVRLRRIARGTD